MIQSPAAATLRFAPILLFLLLLGAFGLSSPRFLEPQNLVNIALQSSSTAIAATGMTFALLTAGVDLSVGAIMFVAVAVAGKMVHHGQPIALAFVAALAAGAAFGALNGLLVARLRILAFIATLGTLFAGRGFGLWLTETRAMNMPESVTRLGTDRWLGVPWAPLAALAAVCLLAHAVLSATPFGRMIYATGHDAEAARKAGVPVRRILFCVYLISGLCAAAGGLVALTQTGAVSPKFGEQKEFAAIAAAVLGGVSLFGGRGAVLPGALLGALLIQTVENGLVILNANPYIYPMVTSGIIFLAVLLDSIRNRAQHSLPGGGHP
ncbi:MAG TPA: ABC transporter permease [Verrucomicrobiales bacterium]|nr:ABC transporter permease [Verrucomicrobiales bacterium]